MSKCHGLDILYRTKVHVAYAFRVWEVKEHPERVFFLQDGEYHMGEADLVFQLILFLIIYHHEYHLEGPTIGLHPILVSSNGPPSPNTIHV